MVATGFTLLLPTMAVTFAISKKLPPRAKEIFFKIPVAISATAVNWIIIHAIIHGVGAGYALLLGDMLLIPAFSLIKKYHQHKKRKDPRYAAECRGEKAIVLPATHPRAIAAAGR
jgi:hypothetical protein